MSVVSQFILKADDELRYPAAANSKASKNFGNR